MMSLIFLILLIAMISVFTGKKGLGYTCFVTSVILSLYWFQHHATDSLSILL
ncbi:DUF5993 family protein [Vibrio campbellii]|uniref:DUF5993 family protein n=1 Tax=Vibrio campbellii TaxID=680 RepID=UPI001C614079|nr:DUF5993 family protein [Vibrio campbellii]